MVELPFTYKVLNALQEPLSSKQLAEKLNIDPLLAKGCCRILHKNGAIKIHSRIKIGYITVVNKFINKSNARFRMCTECKKVFEGIKLINSICAECLSINELEYANIGTSYTQIQHMQNIINDQKRIIYNLQTQLYLLKNDKNV